MLAELKDCVSPVMGEPLKSGGPNQARICRTYCWVKVRLLRATHGPPTEAPEVQMPRSLHLCRILGFGGHGSAGAQTIVLVAKAPPSQRPFGSVSGGAFGVSMRYNYNSAARSEEGSRRSIQDSMYRCSRAALDYDVVALL